MRILANGNVGIGTIVPSEKLEVNGNAIISGIAYASDFSWLSDRKFKENITLSKY